VIQACVRSTTESCGGPARGAVAGCSALLRGLSNAAGRHRRWSADGTGEIVPAVLQAGSDRDAGSEGGGRDGLDRGPGASARGWRPASPPPERAGGQAGAAAVGDTGAWVEGQELRCHTDREALGRSRGGLTTKIHLLADTRCWSMARAPQPTQGRPPPRDIPWPPPAKMARSFCGTSAVSTGFGAVEDDGRRPVGVGLDSMRIRTQAVGGELTVTSGPDGTRVLAGLPLEARR
jgi:hypothetical protein